MPDQDFLSRALTQMPGFLTVMNRAGMVVWLSASGYGTDLADNVGYPSDKFILPEDRPMWWSLFARARDCREVVRYAMRLQLPESATPIRLVGRMGPVVDAAGRVTHVVAMTVDASHQVPEHCSGCPTAFPVSLTVPVPARTEPGLWLSPLEARIVEELGGCNWVVTRDLAQRIGEEPSTEFRAVLRNLAERGIVETHTHFGVRLATSG